MNDEGTSPPHSLSVFEQTSNVESSAGYVCSLNPRLEVSRSSVFGGESLNKHAIRRHKIPESAAVEV